VRELKIEKAGCVHKRHYIFPFQRLNPNPTWQHALLGLDCGLGPNCCLTVLEWNKVHDPLGGPGWFDFPN
jgi:hypothetical protein